MYKMKGIIYKISSPSTDKIYIGSTIQTLKNRMRNHKKKTNHTRSKEIMILGDAVIEGLEEIEFDDIKVLREKEKEYILVNREFCCNHIGKITEGEKKERNKKYNKEWSQTTSGKESAKKKRDKHYEANKEKMREYYRERGRVKVNCPHCNLELNYSSLGRHIKTIHQH